MISSNISLSDSNSNSKTSDISNPDSDINLSSEIKTTKPELEKLIQKDYLYPEQDDPNIQSKIYRKKEFYAYRIPERREYTTYEEIQKHRNELCNPTHFTPHPYQNLLPNIINPETPYMGLIIAHNLGSGKTFTGINIAEKFIEQVKNIIQK